MSLFAQEVNLKINQSFEIESSYKSAGAFVQSNLCNFRIKVTGKDQENNWMLECALERIDAQLGNLGAVNSENVRVTDLNTSYPLLLLALLKNHFSMKISSKGKVVAVEGLEDVIRQAAAKWSLPKVREDEMVRNSKLFPSSILKGLFLEFPEKTLGYGSEWQSGDGLLNYKVTAINGALLDVAYQGKSDKEEESGLKGSLSLNTVTGMVELNQSLTKRLVNVAAGDKKDLIETWSRRLVNSPGKFFVDSAWINMAVKMSPWSTYFKRDATVDASIVKEFFKQYDSQFSSDFYYLNHKLNLIQQAGFGAKDNTYSKVLIETPNYVIAGTHHLHNKMTDVLNLNADSAYSVAKYLAKTSSFYNWTQHSYAQYFLNRKPDKASEENRRKAMQKRGFSTQEIDSLIRLSEGLEGNKYRLKTLLEKDKEDVIQQATKPLCLWVDALSADAKQLKKVSANLRKLDNNYFVNGNAGRYQLLVYQMLLKNGDVDEAAVLLNHAINRLEVLANDTLNAKMYDHRNLLAGAYFQKYQSLKVTDSVQSLSFYSKAAEYSPKGANEKAYTSFYDRVFLKSKESYRKDYIETLLKLGKEKEAMAVFSLHLKANPEDLEAMRKIHESSIPGGDFKRYFSDQFLASWMPTPEFKLTGIDSTVYSLEKFERKWVVLDFWGTWCGPCRKEMPVINKFAKLLEEDKKYGDVKFLSIACRDTEADVKSYLAANNFVIPAAMSDGKVEQNFAVDGYPSKYIIAPNGKMIEIQFGKDWEKILDSFVRYYSAN